MRFLGLPVYQKRSKRLHDSQTTVKIFRKALVRLCVNKGFLVPLIYSNSAQLKILTIYLVNIQNKFIFKL